MIQVVNSLSNAKAARDKADSVMKFVDPEMVHIISGTKYQTLQCGTTRVP